jgi:hypothetical protein
MTDPAILARVERTLTVHVPLTLRRRGGRKLVVTPDGEPAWAPPRARVDNAIIKALARAFRWRDMLEDNTHATIAEIAAAEKINGSYVSRVLRLTLLAPEIVEAILGGRNPVGLTLPVLMRPFPLDWRRQESLGRD